MGVRRTAVVKLAVSDEQRDALHRTAEQYLYCANRTADYCRSDSSYTECKTNKRQVRDALYAELREETDLQAQLVQAAIKRAVEAIKRVTERWKKGQRVSRPTFTAETMDYDARSATIYRNGVSLATVEGRIEPSFVLPGDSPTPYERYVLSEDYEFRESTLRYDAATDEFYLDISTRRTGGDDTEVPTDTGHPDQTVLGIDLGVRKSEALAQPIRNLRFLRTSTASPSRRPPRSGRQTSTITGAASSRSDVVRCNGEEHKPRTTPCFDSGNRRSMAKTVYSYRC